MKINQNAMAVDWNPSLTLTDNTESDINGNISDEVRRSVTEKTEKNPRPIFSCPLGLFEVGTIAMVGNTCRLA